MAVSQASQGCARSSWKYTHTGRRVSVGAVCVASLRAVDGDFIAGAFVSAALCEVVDAVFGDVVEDVVEDVVDAVVGEVVDAIVVSGAGAGNFMEGARSAPTRSRAAKVASGICASMCDQSMNHVGGFAMASWNFCKLRGVNAGPVGCYQTKPKENRATCVARFELYWSIGQYISRKAAKDGWATGTVAELSRTIQRKYPGMTGYSASNLW